MISAIRAWFRSSLDIRKDEYAPVALMLGYGFLALTSYYVVKPARNSIFVDRVGADALPLVYVATAIVVSLVMIFYSRYVDRVGRLTLLLSSMGGLGVTLVGFWWALRGGSGFVLSGAFYIFVKLYPLLLVSQFWLVANLLFTTTQARRLFGAIGVGLILGGIAGSSIAGFTAEAIGTEPLLLVAVGILGLCTLLVLALAPRIRKGAGEATGRLAEEVSGTAVDILKNSTHLKTIAAILGLTIVVGTILDWQLNRAVELFVQGEDAKTEFWGRFYAILNVVSVAIQVVLTGYVLRRFGVGLALLVLPVSLGVASVGIFFLPALMMVAVGKGAEGALRYSLDQSTRELLFLPVPTAEKYKVKPLIDLAVYRAGTGFGGILLLIFVNGLGLSLRWVSLVTLVAIVAWLIAAWRMRSEFASSLRRLLGVRDVRLEELLVRDLNAETIGELEEALKAGDPEKVPYALALLEQAPTSRAVDGVRALLTHDDEEIRARAVSYLTTVEADEAESDVEELLKDPSLYVRAEAIRYLCEVAEGDAARTLRDFLDEDEPEVRMGALGCMIRHGGADDRERGIERLRAMAESNQAEDREAAAVLLGQVGSLPESGQTLLERLTTDRNTDVCHAAIRSIGRAGMTSMLPVVLERFANPDYRAAAMESLEAFGQEAHEELLGLLEDESTEIDLRGQAAGLLVLSPSQGTVDRLLKLLPDFEPPLRYRTLKTLNKIRRDRDDISYEGFEPDELIREEMERTAYFFLARDGLTDGTLSTEDPNLLTALVDQRFREAAERAVRTLALKRPQSDLYAAFRALTSGRKIDQQRGYELIDALLPQRFRTAFDPLLNPDTDPRRRTAMVAETYRRSRMDEEEVVGTLVSSDDLWVAVTARRHCGRDCLPPRWSTDQIAARFRADAAVPQPMALPCDEDGFMDVLDRTEVLKKAKIFEGMRVEDIAAIAAITEEQSFSEGAVVFEQGDPGNELYVVVEGRVLASRDDRELFEARRGRSVGSLSLLDGMPTNYRAKAVEDTETLRVEREPFLKLLQEREQAVTSVLKYLSGVVRGLNEAPDAGEDGEGTEQ